MAAPETPREASLLFAHDLLHPEDGGDHLPVKLASARSSRDTLDLARRLEVFARDAQPKAEASDLFIDGEFVSHSGLTLPFKIDCDALSDSSIETLASEIARRVKFQYVRGVPRGGMRLANALKKHETTGPVLIVDDVLTTGESMEEARRQHTGHNDIIGFVIFARGICPTWITPLFHSTAVRTKAYAVGYDAAIKASAAVANGVRARAAESHEALRPTGNLTLDQLREIDNRLAGQRHAAHEIEDAILALSAHRPAHPAPEPSDE